MSPTLQQFIRDIDAFIAARQMKKTTFGKLAVGDYGFVQKVREGRAVKATTIDRVRDFITKYDDQQSNKAA